MVRTRLGEFREGREDTWAASVGRQRPNRYVSEARAAMQNGITARQSDHPHDELRQKVASSHLQRVPYSHLRLKRDSSGVLRLALADHVQDAYAPPTKPTSVASAPVDSQPSSARYNARSSGTSAIRQHRAWQSWPTANPRARAAHPSASRAPPPAPHRSHQDVRWRGQSFHVPPATPREDVLDAASHRLPSYREPSPRPFNFVRPDLSNPPSARDRWVPPRPGDWFEA